MPMVAPKAVELWEQILSEKREEQERARKKLVADVKSDARKWQQEQQRKNPEGVADGKGFS